MALNKKAFFSIAIVFISTLTVAQDSIPKTYHIQSIPVEIMFGNNRMAYQMIVHKKLSENSRFGFFNISSFAVDYQNDKSKNEYTTLVLVNYELVKGFGIASGAAVNSNWGFRPYAGVQYIFSNQNILAIVEPGFYLTESHNFKTLAIIEFKRQLKNNWSLYSRLQGLYSQNLQTNHHDRSYIYPRLGLKYKNFGFGLGSNIDWYGPFKELKQNYGLFLLTTL
jgi:hypothetical protein